MTQHSCCCTASTAAGWAQGEQSSKFIQAIGGPTVAYIVIVAFGVATVINLEACLLVLVAEFEGRENRCERQRERRRELCGWRVTVPGPSCMH